VDVTGQSGSTTPASGNGRHGEHYPANGWADSWSGAGSALEPEPDSVVPAWRRGMDALGQSRAHTPPRYAEILADNGVRPPAEPDEEHAFEAPDAAEPPEFAPLRPEQFDGLPDDDLLGTAPLGGPFGSFGDAETFGGPGAETDDYGPGIFDDNTPPHGMSPYSQLFAIPPVPSAPPSSAPPSSAPPVSSAPAVSSAPVASAPPVSSSAPPVPPGLRPVSATPPGYPPQTYPRVKPNRPIKLVRPAPPVQPAPPAQQAGSAVVPEPAVHPLPPGYPPPQAQPGMYGDAVRNRPIPPERPRALPRAPEPNPRVPAGEAGWAGNNPPADAGWPGDNPPADAGWPGDNPPADAGWPGDNPPGGPRRSRAGHGLPQRVPAAPDVPGFVEPAATEPPAPAPVLSRVASGLRRDDLPAAERANPFDVAAVLSAVRDVPGVKDAQLRATDTGGHTLRLDLADGSDPAYVSRVVARMLNERMGLVAQPPGRGEPDVADGPRRPGMEPATGRVAVPHAPRSAPPLPPGLVPASAAPRDPRRRHPIAMRGGRYPTETRPGDRVETEQGRPPALTPPGDESRVMLDHVQVSTFGLDATVEVRLVFGDRVALGVSNGPAVDGYILRLSAAAAANAVDELLAEAALSAAGRGHCYVEQAAIVPLGSCEVAVVVVLLLCDGRVEQLAGSAIVAGDPRQAIVRATLAAVNRRLTALLP
jgi:hypothetical protein